MKNVLLITNGFPFGDSERGFITTEFYELIGKFNVVILAVDREEKIINPIPKEIKVIKYKNPYDEYKTIFSRIYRVASSFKEIKRKEIREELKILRKQDKLNFNLLRSVLIYSFSASTLENLICKLIMDNHIDIIYSYWCLPITVTALRMKNIFPNLKVVSRFHGFDLYNERNEYGFQVLRDYISENCDRLVFACQYAKSYFNSYWGGGEKSIVSYLGTRSMTPLNVKKQSSLVMISCSNLIPLKRVDLIIKALAEVKEEVQIEWYHIGDGSLKKDIEMIAHSLLNQKENVKWSFLGRCSNDEIEKYYCKIKPDVFITTTESEGGAPVSIQEAFAMGIPAIGTAVGGVVDLIIDGCTGFLLNKNPSPKEIANVIEKFFYTDIDIRNRISEQCIELWAEKLNAQKNANYIIDLINEL